MSVQNLPTGTQVSYYHLCHRKVWLFAHNINMEHTSDLVYEGKLISETTYLQRAKKYIEVQIGPIKIDFFDAKNKVVHETKKSNKRSELHLWQVKYYLYVLEKAGVEGATAILEYPKLRLKEEVLFSDLERAYLDEIIPKIQAIKEATICPPKLERKKCKNCSYFDFCWTEE